MTGVNAVDGSAMGPAPDSARRGSRTRRGGPLGRIVRNPLGVISALAIGVFVVIAVAAPLLTGHDPDAQNLGNALADPSGEHLLGTDALGRDVLARMLHGARTSLIAGLVAVGFALLVGVPLGIAAAYYGRLLDGVASWIANAIVAVPGIIVILVLIMSFGSNMFLAMAAFGVLISPAFYRLTRAATLRVRNEAYVDAARVTGLSDLRIMTRHITRVVRAPIIIQASMMVGAGIGFQAGLAFLGLGSAQDVSWGAMLNDGFRNIYIAPFLTYPPGLAITLVVAAFTIFGTALRDALEDDDTAPAEPITDVAAAEDRSRANALTDGSAILRMRDLTVSYPGGEPVVDRVSLSLNSGEVLGLVGESGSGKTQTAFALLGLLPARANVSWTSYSMAGTSFTAPSVKGLGDFRGRRIAYIPQEPSSNLDPSFRIGTQLVEPMRHHLGLTRAAAKHCSIELLDRVGIRDAERVFDQYPHRISGGMAQRVLIAIAISCEPDVLVADEPTTALDVTVQAEILDLLRGLQQERDLAVLMVTHDFGVVADICHRVAVMQQGILVECGDVRDVFANPSHEYTKLLLSSTLEDKEPFSTLVPAGADAR